MANVYDYGDLVRVSAVFSNIAGAAQDPDVVFLQVLNPAGVTTEYEYLVDVGVVRDLQGHYHYNVDANAPGVWWYRWYSTGAGQAADEYRFKVRPSRFG